MKFPLKKMRKLLILDPQELEKKLKNFRMIEEQRKGTELVWFRTEAKMHLCTECIFLLICMEEKNMYLSRGRKSVKRPNFIVVLI